MSENVFLWMHIHFCLYISEYSLFYKALSISAFVKISGLIRIYQIFFSIDFHDNIDIKLYMPIFTIFSYFYS